MCVLAFLILLCPSFRSISSSQHGFLSLLRKTAASEIGDLGRPHTDPAAPAEWLHPLRPILASHLVTALVIRRPQDSAPPGGMSLNHNWD